MAIRMVDVLSARSRSRFLEAALARAAGELELEKRLRLEALELQERAQSMQRRKSANEDRKILEGWGRVFDALDRRKERA